MRIVAFCIVICGALIFSCRDNKPSPAPSAAPSAAKAVAPEFAVVPVNQPDAKRIDVRVGIRTFVFGVDEGRRIGERMKETEEYYQKFKASNGGETYASRTIVDHRIDFHLSDKFGFSVGLTNAVGGEYCILERGVAMRLGDALISAADSFGPSAP